MLLQKGLKALGCDYQGKMKISYIVNVLKRSYHSGDKVQATVSAKAQSMISLETNQGNYMCLSIYRSGEGAFMPGQGLKTCEGRTPDHAFSRDRSGPYLPNLECTGLQT